jgi:hypothetical protein
LEEELLDWRRSCPASWLNLLSGKREMVVCGTINPSVIRNTREVTVAGNGNRSLMPGGFRNQLTQVLEIMAFREWARMI